MKTVIIRAKVPDDFDVSEVVRIIHLSGECEIIPKPTDEDISTQALTKGALNPIVMGGIKFGAKWLRSQIWGGE